MTANRRIFWNVVATYGRSVYALICGLFTARWSLQALGAADYGLYGLVGGLTAFVLFFNGLLSGAVSRYYAYAVGKASVCSDDVSGVEECQRWFSIAVFIHTLVPVILVSVGYFIGEIAIIWSFNIPPDRVGACIWVWRYTCLSCFVSMLNVPYQAMYIAKQRIAELTIYSVVTTTLNVMFLYYIVTHDGDWLVAFAAWFCAVSVVPQIIICIRALLVFEECKFKRAYVFDKERIKSLFAFAGMNMFGALSQVCSVQGMNILVNKFFGPARNATVTIATGVNGHASALSSALLGAFQPAITNAAGAGNMARMRSLVMRQCSFGTIGVLMFALPLMLEMPEVLVLWLGNPPDFASELCILYLVVSIVEKLTDGHWVAIFAIGRIAMFRIMEAVTYWMTLAVAVVMMLSGCDVVSAGVALLIGRGGSLLVKLYCGRSIAGISIRSWISKILIPILCMTLVTVAVGILPQLLLSRSFVRLLVTTVVCEATILPFIWFMILSSEDRVLISQKLMLLRGRLPIS